MVKGWSSPPPPRFWSGRGGVVVGSWWGRGGVVVGRGLV